MVVRARLLPDTLIVYIESESERPLTFKRDFPPPPIRHNMETPKLQVSPPHYSFKIPPEWLTVAQACEFSHMGKTSLYSYLDINGGKIKTACIRKRNCVKGKRLISLDSLRLFIASFVEEAGR